MIGVWIDFLRLRISAAVSNPFIPAMLTSSRMTANSSRRMWPRASSPERASMRFWPRLSRMERYESRFSGRSSTTRMLTASLGILKFLGQADARHQTIAHRASKLPIEPGPEDGDHLLRVHGLGEVIPSSSFDA